MDAIVGVCLCGGVKWSVPITTPCAQILICNCKLCQKQSGAVAGVAFGAFPRHKIKWEEDKTLRKIRMSDVATRYFCTICGSFVYMDYNEPHTLWMTLALLEKEDLAKVTSDYNARLDSKTPPFAYPPSQIFAESISMEFEDYSSSFPKVEQFGTYVINCCDPDERKKKTGNWQDETDLQKQAKY